MFEVRQLVIANEATWDALVNLFNAGNLDMVQIPRDPDDLPTYVLGLRG